MCLRHAARLVLLALCLALADPAWAQDCNLGIFGDEGGLDNGGYATSEQSGGIYRAEIYYVIRTEGYLMAAAWSTEVVGDFTILARQGYIDDYATFLESREEGYRVGLGTCYWGTMQPITILREVLFLQHDYLAPTEGSVERSPWFEPALIAAPNPIQDPFHIIVSDCTGVLRTCEPGSMLLLRFIVPVEGESFGRIKAMYR